MLRRQVCGQLRPLTIVARYASTKAVPHKPKPIKTFNKQSPERVTNTAHVSLPYDRYLEAMEAPITNMGLSGILAAQKGDLKLDDVRDIRDSLNLAGKSAIITGATGGLGLEYASTLLPLGVAVHVIDMKTPGNDYEAVKQYTDWLKETHRAPTADLQYHKGDVTNAEEMYSLVGKIADEHGGLDIAIANAGIIGDTSPVEEYSPETFKRVMAVNVDGANNTAAAAARAMKRHISEGRIIFTASMSGSIINRDMGWSAYTSSKAAVKHLAKTYAVQLAPFGITSNSISPGHMRTSMTASLLDTKPGLENCWAGQNAMRRLGSPHELAGAIAYLCMQSSTYTTGADIVVDGGHSAW